MAKALNELGGKQRVKQRLKLKYVFSHREMDLMLQKYSFSMLSF